MKILHSTTYKVLVSFRDNEEIPETIKHFDGSKNRTFTHHICRCGQHFYKKQRKQKSSEHFCSTECMSVSNRFEFNCAYCGKHNSRRLSKKSNSIHGLHYCNRACKELDQRISTGTSAIQPDHYGETYSKYNYRLPAIREHGAKCTRCSYEDDDRMLDVHHKDEDRNNNDLSNLEVLCVWCHALETRKHWQHIM